MKHAKVILVAALLTASLTARAQEAQKVQFDPSGWLVLSGFQNRGEFDARELPRFVAAEPAIRPEASGYAVRQSRLRFALTIPTDNYLAGATLKGLVEADFLGGAAGTTVDGVLPRLRHAYLSANWKAANLSLLVGQTWGIAMPAPSGWASSLSHLAVPRFGGAGFLYRRAPQIKLSGEVTSGIETVSIAVGALSAGDVTSATSGAPGNQTYMPNFEARIASSAKIGGAVKSFDVGLSGHWGQERYTTNPAGGTLNAAVNATSLLASADAKLDFGFAALIGGIWQGQNLDNYASVAGVGVGATPLASRFGVLIDTTVLGSPAAPVAQEIKTKGAWAQLQVTPVKGLQGVIGYGFENPDDSTLALLGATPANGAILRNTQYSAGLIWSVTSKWRVSFEATRYLTFVQAATPTGNDTLTGNQFEIGSLLAI